MSSKDISGYRKIKRFSRYRINRRGTVIKLSITDKVLGPVKPDISGNGFKKVTMINDDDDTVTISLHRLVAKIFVPNKDPCKFIYVGFHDGVKVNCDESNLFWSATNRRINDKIEMDSLEDVARRSVRSRSLSHQRKRKRR